MKTKTAKIIIPAAVVVTALLIVFFIKSNPPEARRFGSAPKAAISVSVLEVVPQSYQVMIDSYGTVKPRTQSLLVAQASGQIIDVSDEFREGGFFEKGDVLLKLDDRDHQAEVKSAQANLLTAEQSLLEEKARGQQALTDWKRLGGSSQASSLVLREPQLAAAQAQVLSAQATLEKAELDLERTKVTAPYAGRILSRSVDLGQVVSNNTQLARTEGAIDENAQQLYVVAKIDDPYKSTESNQYPIKIGQYIKAQIAGKTVQNALIIPNSTIYQGTYVYVVEGDVLKRKDVTFAWQNANQAMIKTGLKANDKLVITPLGQVSSGTKVSILGEEPKEKKPKGMRPSREQLEQKAKELGISVEELIKKRRAAKQGDKA